MVNEVPTHALHNVRTIPRETKQKFKSPMETGKIGSSRKSRELALEEVVQERCMYLVADKPLRRSSRHSPPFNPLRGHACLHVLSTQSQILHAQNHVVVRVELRSEPVCTWNYVEPLLHVPIG